MKRKVLWPKRHPLGFMASPGCQRRGCCFGFCTCTLVTLYSCVPVVYAGVSSFPPLSVSRTQHVGTQLWPNGDPSPRQAADNPPLDLGSVVKLSLENSIALATIYFCKLRRKLCRLRCFSTKASYFGGMYPTKDVEGECWWAKGYLGHNFFKRLQQQTKTAALKKVHYCLQVQSV